MGITDVFTGDPLREGADAKAAALRAGLTQYGDLAGQGRTALQGNYAQAANQWATLQPGANAGYNTYLDATGANGPEGLARARANYGAMVQPDINMGTDALIRARNATGGAAGNTMVDALKFAQNESAKNYQTNYVGNLEKFLPEANTVAGGLSNVYTGLGTGLANSFTGQGQAALDTSKGLGDAANDAATAGYVGSQNLWNFGGNLLKSGMQAFGGGLFGGGGANRGGMGLGNNNSTGRLY